MKVVRWRVVLQAPKGVGSRGLSLLGNCIQSCRSVSFVSCRHSPRAVLYQNTPLHLISMPSADFSSTLNSDTLLGCIFLVAIGLVSLKLFSVRFVFERNHAALGISTAATAYKSYEKISKSSARKMRTTFHAGLRSAGNTKRIANEIGYAEKLDKLERAIEVNAAVSGGIYRLATTEHEANLKDSDTSVGSVIEDVHVATEDHAKVREALKHFVRDWSKEGRRERHQTFGLVLDVLKRLESEVGGRRMKRVLVPGAGLGRLAWEISQLGSFTSSVRPQASLTVLIRLPQDSTRRQTSVRTL